MIGLTSGVFEQISESGICPKFLAGTYDRSK